MSSSTRRPRQAIPAARVVHCAASFGEHAQHARPRTPCLFSCDCESLCAELLCLQLCFLISVDRSEPSHAAAESPARDPPSAGPPPSPPVKMTLTNTEAATTATENLTESAVLSVSASAPQLQGGHALDATSVPFSPSFDTALMQSSRNSSADALPGTSSADGNGSESATSQEVDPSILEALRSKDRLWVLKLGEMMESLINDRRYVTPLLCQLYNIHRPMGQLSLFLWSLGRQTHRVFHLTSSL